jgi:hypothetical protein
MESWGLEGGPTASSDADGKTNHGAIRSRRDTCGADLNDLKAARSRVQLQRDLDAKRIHYEQRSKRLKIEAWVLGQRSLALTREADELDRWLARKIKEGTLDDDSELEPVPEPEATMMTCDDDETERASERSDAYAPTEVYSESDQQAWVLLAQQQGIALQL